MAENTGGIRTLIGYTYDKQSADNVISGARTLSSELQKVVAAAKQLDVTGGSVGVQKLNNDFDAFSVRVKAAQADLAALRAEIVGVKGDAADFPTFSDKELFDTGGGGRKQGLGSKIRSLPSTQIPGLGIGTDAIGNLVRIVEAIPPAAYPAVAAIAALTAGVAIIAKNVPDVTSGIREITALDKAYYEARISGTRESIKALIEQKQLDQKIAQARVDDLQFVAQGYDIIKQKSGDALGGVLIGITEVAGALGATNFKDVRDARIAYDQAQEALKKANKELGLYNGLLDDQTVAVNTAAEATKKLKEAISDNIIGAISSYADAQTQVNQLITSGSQKDLDAKKESLAATILNAETQKTALQANIDRYKDNVEAQKPFIDAFKQQDGIYKDATRTLAAISTAAVEAAVKLNDANDILKKQKEDESKAVQKFNDDIASLNEKKSQSEIDLWTKLTDKQVSIAEKAQDDVQKALDALVAKEQSLRLNLTRSLESDTAKAQFDALQAQIKFNRNEVQEEQKVRDKIADIQKKAAEDEFELGLSRNFAQLAASRRQTQQAVAQVNVEAQRARADRLQAFQDATSDQQATFIFERQQKLIKYQQDLDDAKAAELAQLKTIEKEKQKQLTAAITAYNREYAAIQQKYAAEIAAQQAGIQNELNAIIAGENGKNAVLEAGAAQAKRILAGIFDPIGGVPNAGGGTSATPSQNIRGSGLRVGNFPTRSPLFAGAGGGSSTNNSSNLVQNNYFTGVDPQKLLPQIEKRTRDLLADTVVRMNQR